jgi:hypothetical protein
MTIEVEFNRELSYFPTEGRLDDKFNGDFKLVLDVTGDASILPGKLGVGVRWKGTVYLMWTNEEMVTPPVRITLRWIDEPPTIAEFLTGFGEELPKETTSYSYSWVVGFLEDDLIDIVDEWKTELLVIVPPFPWDKILIAAGVGAVALGTMAVLAKRPQYARRAYEYARRGVEYVRERIPARA